LELYESGHAVVADYMSLSKEKKKNKKNILKP